MLLIYTQKITPRVRYIINHFFENLIPIDFELTSDFDSFTQHSGSKLNYSRKRLGDDFFILSHDLLFDQGVGTVDIEVFEWKGSPCFFAVGKQSDLPFDIFAASFFLLSRYEEHYPSLRDPHGRYNYRDSLAFKYDFLDKPLIDIWVKQFSKLLSEKYPDIKPKKQLFKQQYLIDVNEFYSFRSKGLLRTFGGTMIDAYHLKFNRIVDRYAVLLRLKKDPYDIFEDLKKISQKMKNIEFLFFIHVGDYGLYDKSISYMKSKYRSQLMGVSDYHKMNVLLSYESFGNSKKIESEVKRLEDILKREIKNVRFHLNRLEVPNTYRMLVENEITDDYTMGYPDALGFRASTSTPFYYYDPVYEIQLNLKIHPFCIYKSTLFHQKNRKNIIQKYRETVKNVDGHFIIVLSNALLSKSKNEWPEIIT